MHSGSRVVPEDYAQAQFVDRGMVADIALHAPGRDGDERNHHAHILLTTREMDWPGRALFPHRNQPQRRTPDGTLHNHRTGYRHG